ncbi:MAG: S-methyl-5-thioribose-1-phosphate isomerase [Nanoarchaeota archaeon]|nr:S-methyl-5-thioribose-1-phosphate isomerase [Nanoarchaeota archaeon]
MHIKGKNYRTVWYEEGVIFAIDQPKLPHSFEIVKLYNHNEVYDAIKTMVIRGAPAIGATGCFGMAQAIANYDGEGDFKEFLEEISSYLKSSRPTAYDLTHGISHILEAVKGKSLLEAKKIAEREAQKYADDSVDACRKIGEYGNELITDGMNILTHCNAGALATVDYGTALAPIRIAHSSGKKIHVFADETRPRCQGARLTAFELAEEGIKHDIIVDNAAGHFIRKGEIDMVITGSDRVAINGDAANKIGTYEKAVLAKENNIPFYVAVPFSTIDFNCPDGDKIPIEERNEDEVLYMSGWSDKGEFERVRISPDKSTARNPAFDVTPAKYITGIITEKGIFKPEEIRKLKNG